MGTKAAKKPAGKNEILRVCFAGGLLVGALHPRSVPPLGGSSHPAKAARCYRQVTPTELRKQSIKARSFLQTSLQTGHSYGVENKKSMRRTVATDITTDRSLLRS